jgi:hypothetical protein
MMLTLPTRVAHSHPGLSCSLRRSSQHSHSGIGLDQGWAPLLLCLSTEHMLYYDCLFFPAYPAYMTRFLIFWILYVYIDSHTLPQVYKFPSLQHPSGSSDSYVTEPARLHQLGLPQALSVLEPHGCLPGSAGSFLGWPSCLLDPRCSPAGSSSDGAGLLTPGALRKAAWKDRFWSLAYLKWPYSTLAQNCWHRILNCKAISPLCSSFL